MVEVRLVSFHTFGDLEMIAQIEEVVYTEEFVTFVEENGGDIDYLYSCMLVLEDRIYPPGHNQELKKKWKEELLRRKIAEETIQRWIDKFQA